ncbi:MAG: glycosyltransferase family A protein [Flavipsychrobacter sp.]|nr:glycosyltransferase family A protein [Flavipsychrobacter sp.]
MSQTDPFISIVIPSYNRATFLEQNIPALLKLDYDAYELIVVDDGSTDNTSAVFDKLKDPKLTYLKKNNEERAAARNYGAIRAHGDYITFLDSDDILFPDALRKAASVIGKKGNPDFLHLAYEIGTEQKASKTINNLKEDPLILVQGNPLSCIGVFIKKEVFEKHQFTPDRALAGSEDWEFWLRLAANYGIRTSNEVVGRLIEHDTRSVISAPEDALLRKQALSFQYSFADSAVQKVFGPYKKLMMAHWETYISLHLAMNGEKKHAIHYLFSAIRYNISSIFNKRTLVICKLLLQKHK